MTVEVAIKILLLKDKLLNWYRVNVRVQTATVPALNNIIRVQSAIVHVQRSKV